MDDMEGRVRELLRHRAEDVPPQLDVPPELAGRGHRRFAVNALGAVVVAAVLVAGVFAGVRAIGPDRRSARHVRSFRRRHPGLFTVADHRDAGAGRSDGFARGLDRPQERVGRYLHARGERPTLTLLDGSGVTIDSGVTFDKVDATWVVNDAPRPDGWPVVTLAGGEHADVRFSWSNWCGDPSVYWRLALPAGGTMEVEPGRDGVPPCNGPGQPSVIEIGPVEPSS